jgi:predicted transcriptional regulator
MTKKDIQNRALSVRQPFAEQIMLGTKKIEYRSMKTNIRGRVYIYASLSRE